MLSSPMQGLSCLEGVLLAGLEISSCQLACGTPTSCKCALKSDCCMYDIIYVESVDVNLECVLEVIAVRFYHTLV